jgi:hypothetical protein
MLVAVIGLGWGAWQSSHRTPPRVSLRRLTNSRIDVSVVGAPQGWSGQLNLNNVRRFPLNATHHLLDLTSADGWNAKGENFLFAVLRDQNGRELPLPNHGRVAAEFALSMPNNPPAAPAAVTAVLVDLVPDSRNLPAEGGAGVVAVSAPAGRSWSVGATPPWVKIVPGGRSFSYRVDANPTNDLRTADVAVGDGVFRVVQFRPAAIQLPFHEMFRSRRTPVPIFTLAGRSENPLGSPTRWVLDEQPGQTSLLAVEPEPAGGGNRLSIQRLQADPRAWATQIQLPGIAAKMGEDYRVSISMKADTPGPVSVIFEQRTAPFGNCGLVWTFPVSIRWELYRTAFQAKGEGCGAANNRLSIQVGRFAGKVWISDFSIGR